MASILSSDVDPSSNQAMLFVSVLRPMPMNYYLMLVAGVASEVRSAVPNGCPRPLSNAHPLFPIVGWLECEIDV